MLFETNKYFWQSLRQRKKKASLHVVPSFLFESSKSFSGISVMQNPYKKKLNEFVVIWMTFYQINILLSLHCLQRVMKSLLINEFVDIVFCFHFFLENISMRQKNWAAGLSEDFSFTTRVRLGLSIVKNVILIRHHIPLDANPQGDQWVCDWLVTLFLSLLLTFQLSYQYWWQFRKNPCK